MKAEASKAATAAGGGAACGAATGESMRSARSVFAAVFVQTIRIMGNVRAQIHAKDRPGRG